MKLVGIVALLGILVQANVKAQCPVMDLDLSAKVNEELGHKKDSISREISEPLKKHCGILPVDQTKYNIQYKAGDVRLRSSKDEKGNMAYKMTSGDKKWSIKSNNNSLDSRYSAPGIVYELRQSAGKTLEKLKSDTLEYSFKKDSLKSVEIYKTPSTMWQIDEYKNGQKIIDYASTTEKFKYVMDANGQSHYEYFYDQEGEKVEVEKFANGKSVVKQEKQLSEGEELSKAIE